MNENMTIKTIEAINKAVEYQKEFQNPEITPYHLALSMAQSDSVVGLIFTKLNIDKNNLIKDIESEINKLPKSTNQGAYMSKSLSDVLAQAYKIRGDFKDSYLSLEHILLAMIDKSELKNIFDKYNINKNKIINIYIYTV